MEKTQRNEAQHRGRLSRQIVLSMGLVSIITMLIAFVGSVVIYGWLYALSPPELPKTPVEWLIPDSIDFLIFATLLLIGLVVAVVMASRLARRILAPLNSLAEGARRIAAGDLEARALPGDRSLGDTALLVDDFNAMAIRLQQMAADMTAWNAAIAHELRTPLTILRGRLQGMRDGVFKPDDAQIRGLLYQVEGLARIVDDLHIITLQDIGRLEMHFEPTRIDIEIRRAVDSISDALYEAGFTIELDVSDAMVVCDGARIRQALLALLDNARRYAIPGRLRVALGLAPAALVLSVEDGGPGLAPEFAKLVFEPFTRADASRSRQFGGSGLGLSVVRAIALAHRGRATFRPSAAGGSIFELTLPRI
ncbi:HAMP domain-containing protein [Caballeronia novacaledonica]|uniref:HAMP domain-containing protein n=2 Tax=Caballeronia novacaledonica TaxID=1544861 RepID=A0ACB5R3A5_9BURK|nr:MULTISPECIES: ATP-binding protein [Caballeronia]KXV16029.1 histidine kinase [Caballeronia megalochromosomata]BCQ28683.1 HAMP domain-containing protein [Caballeronia sp. NK8]GJH21427.1 HAMP domain-containing protein [Caballeronia novacaledonica]GJH29041.1 HAMP domain-containing protein [Caballeronia novacaledonica]